MGPRLCNWLDDTPPIQKATLVILVLCLLGVIFWLFVADPAIRELEILQQENHGLQRELVEHDQKILRLIDLQTDIARLEQRIHVKETTLGLSVGVGQLVKPILDTAQRQGLLVTLWKPGFAVEDSHLPFLKVPMTLRVEGTYHHVGVFLDHLRTLPKVITVAGFRMSKAAPRGIDSRLQVSLDLVGYESEQSRMAAGVDNTPSATIRNSVKTEVVS